MTRPYRILFLSRRGSARGLMAEGIVNRLGAGRFQAFSGAIEPDTAADPVAIELMKAYGIETEGLHPKPYSHFVGDSVADFDFIFTLSDTASKEAQPNWRGVPITASWSCPDPVRQTSDPEARRRMLLSIFAELDRRLRIFMSLPLDSLDRISLGRRVQDIADKDFGTA